MADDNRAGRESLDCVPLPKFREAYTRLKSSAAVKDELAQVNGILAAHGMDPKRFEIKVRAQPSTPKHSHRESH